MSGLGIADPLILSIDLVVAVNVNSALGNLERIGAVGTEQMAIGRE